MNAPLLTTLIALPWLFLGMACNNASTKNSEKTTTYSEATEALYMERFNARGKAQATGLSKYSPLASVAGQYQALPQSNNTSISQEVLNKLSDYLGGMNSSSFIIWRNGAVEYETYFGDHNKDSLIVSKSLAKPLATIAVGRAIQEGYIKSLDQSVSDYITEWKDTPKDKILIRHLLDMRTGLLPQGQELSSDHVMNRAYMHPHHDEVIINDYPLVNEPGARYDYANANSELVAPLIERATGTQYEEWVSDEIFKPIGAKGGQIWMNREGGTPHSGCCILLPAETYLRLAVLLLKKGDWNGERLLSEDFVKDVHTATPQNPHTGLGVYVAGPYIEKRGPLNPDIPLGQTLHSEPYLADDIYLFDGNGHQTAYIIPSANMVILRTGSWAPKGKTWDNSKLPNMILAATEFPGGSHPTPQK